MSGGCKQYRKVSQRFAYGFDCAHAIVHKQQNGFSIQMGEQRL
ncbi:Uncharacterised protein [Vibrio cholerae]|nr:Uncharacterised protein [Vibrio cholerae]